MLVKCFKNNIDHLRIQAHLFVLRLLFGIMQWGKFYFDLCNKSEVIFKPTFMCSDQFFYVSISIQIKLSIHLLCVRETSCSLITSVLLSFLLCKVVIINDQEMLKLKN